MRTSAEATTSSYHHCNTHPRADITAAIRPQTAGQRADPGGIAPAATCNPQRRAPWLPRSLRRSPASHARQNVPSAPGWLLAPTTRGTCRIRRISRAADSPSCHGWQRTASARSGKQVPGGGQSRLPAGDGARQRAGVRAQAAPALPADALAGCPCSPALHARKAKLVAPDLAQERLQDRDLAFGLKAGLHPAQAAVALLQRHDAPAGRAVTGLMGLAEGVAGPAVPAGEHAPGKAAEAARGELAR